MLIIQAVYLIGNPEICQKNPAVAKMIRPFRGRSLKIQHFPISVFKSLETLKPLLFSYIHKHMHNITSFNLCVAELARAPYRAKNH